MNCYGKGVVSVFAFGTYYIFLVQETVSMMFEERGGLAKCFFFLCSIAGGF